MADPFIAAYANDVPRASFDPIAHVKAFCNTGFSGLNTPASPEHLLNASEKVLNLPDINCLPLIGQTNATINIPAYDDIIDTDYMSIEFAGTVTYWLKGSYSYLAGDTISVSLTLDGFLTIGGVPGISSVSGYVKRRTTPTDEFGQYDQDDPMIVPSQALKIRQIVDSGVVNSKTEITLLMSTIDLFEIGKVTEAEFKGKFGLTYGDGEFSVTAPNFPGVKNETTIEMTGANKTYNVPAVQFFYVQGGNATRAYGLGNGISRARSVGVDEAILDQYSVPFDLITVETEGQPAVAPYVTKITAKENTAKPTIDFKGYYTPNNKKVLYGQYTTVKLLAVASGESYDFRVEDLDTDNFEIAAIADPRPDGQPIIFPKKYKGQSQSIQNMLVCVRGLTWNKAPIRFNWASGYSMDFARYNANYNFQKQQLLQQQDIDGRNFTNNSIGRLLGIAGSYGGAVQAGINVGSAFSNPTSMINPGGFVGMAGGILNSALNINRNIDAIKNDYLSQVYKAANFDTARAIEKQEMILDNAIVAPTIAHAPTPSIRDFTGNGAIVCLTTPTDDDLKRFDKIYNMFGYYDPGTALSLSDFSNGLNWTYLEANHVSLKTKGKFGRFIIHQAEAQIEAGIRIWTRKPDFALYDQSNRKTAAATE